MIDKRTVAQILDTARIEDVVGDFVSLRKRGANLIGLCPFHNEKTGSFTVSPARGIFKCFGCGEGGNSVSFIMKHEHLSYPDALRFLAKKYHIEIEEKELTEEEKRTISDREIMLNINDFASKYFINNFAKTEGKTIGLSYFKERGFRDDMIKFFQLGYALESSDDFYNEANKRGFSIDYLKKIGLVAQNDRGDVFDRFRGRVMFPIHSLSGKVVGFGGRILKKSDKLAKYINSPESEIYNKSNELYGIFFAKNQIVKQDRCFLVEGYTDVISMYQSGVQNVVASSGTSLTEQQIKLIHRFTNNITVIYDGDNAGIHASIRGIDMLLEQGMNVKVVLLPQGEDPDSFAQKNNSSDFIRYVESSQTDFIEFKINLLEKDSKNDPVKKASLIGGIIKSISVIPDQIIRATYIKETSSRLDIEESILHNEVNKHLRKAYEDKIKKENLNNLHDDNISIVGNKPVNLNTTHVSYNSLYKHEKELVRFIVTHGQKELVEDANNKKGYLSVGEYIYISIKENGLKLENPVFLRIMEEFYDNIDIDGFNCENYFQYHENKEIQDLAIDFLSDKYDYSNFGDEARTSDIIVPEIVEGDEQSVIIREIALLRKAKEEKKIKLEEREALKQLKISLDKIILEYVYAKLNLKLRAMLKDSKSGESSKDFSSIVKKRYNLIEKELKGRVIANIK